LVEWWSIPQVIEHWREITGEAVSEARVKKLCGEGRIPSAKRLKVGRGRPWAIKATWNGERYVVSVTPRTKGPEPKIPMSLSKSEEEAPF
jgi:hypothetical protein